MRKGKIMREIDYRVVDLTYGDHPIKKVTEIVFDEKGINQINVDYGADILYPEKESILLQYTGLKDKHGKKSMKTTYALLRVASAYTGA